MKLSSLSYFIKEGFGSIFRNKLMSFASIAVVCACIFIMSFTYCIGSNINYFMEQLEDTIGIAVFLDDGVASEDIQRVSDELKAIPNISKITFVSPDEALMGLVKDWGVEDGVLEGFTSENNPLSNSFELELEDISKQTETISAIEKIEGIRNIRHAQSESDMLVSVEKMFRYGGIAIIVVLAVISVVIIMNTIKLSVFTRRTEINIMKFVGATDWFIRWPFVIEGVIMGLIGAIIPMVVSWALYDKGIELLVRNFPVLQNLVEFRYSIDIFSVLFPYALLAGIVLGVVGSVTSIHKYLKV